MGRRNQKNEPLDQTGPASRYTNRTGAYADDQADNSRNCLDADRDWAQGTANYGRPSGANVSYRHGSIRP
jgi:hypothetical protein